MATVIEFPSSPSVRSRHPAGRVSPARVSSSRVSSSRFPSNRAPVRPLPLFLALAAVLVFFAGVRSMQHAGAAGAVGSEPVVSVVAPSILVGDVPPGTEEVVVVEVKSGDSLWSIATALQPTRDPRPLVAAMVEANGGSTVQIGQEIVIPVRLLGEATALR